VGQGSVLVWRVDDRRDRSTRAGARARMNRWVVLALFAAACGQKTTTTTSTGTPGGVIKSGGAEDGSLLPQLPKAVAVDTQKFAGVIVCDRCHTAGDVGGTTEKSMRNSKGIDISPVT